MTSVLALTLAGILLVKTLNQHPRQTPFVSFVSEYNQVAYGGTVKLRWLSSHAATCHLERMGPGNRMLTYEEVSVNGSRTFGHLTRLIVVRIECNSKPHKVSGSPGETESLYTQDVSVIDVSSSSKV